MHNVRPKNGLAFADVHKIKWNNHGVTNWCVPGDLLFHFDSKSNEAFSQNPNLNLAHIGTDNSLALKDKPFAENILPHIRRSQNGKYS